MTAKELIDYLARWPSDSDVSFAAIRVKQRIGYQAKRIVCITDDTTPVIILEVDEGTPMGEEEEE